MTKVKRDFNMISFLANIKDFWHHDFCHTALTRMIASVSPQTEVMKITWQLQLESFLRQLNIEPVDKSLSDSFFVPHILGQKAAATFGCLLPIRAAAAPVAALLFTLPLNFNQTNKPILFTEGALIASTVIKFSSELNVSVNLGASVRIKKLSPRGAFVLFCPFDAGHY